MAKKSEKKMMTQYEEDCMWMSYRYCIGRHTIAAHSHAADIAKNCYKRMGDSQSEFTASDIRNEIASQLRMESFMFYEDNRSEIALPLEHFFGWLNGKSKYDLQQVKKIVWKSDDNYDVTYIEETKDVRYFSPQFNDLIEWSNLASLFDIKNHKWCKLIDDTYCEYFEGYVDRTQYDEDPKKTIYNYEKIKIPVSEFSKGLTNRYIHVESIKEDNIQ